MDDVTFVPASQDVALLELRRLHENSRIRRADYQIILQALIPGGDLLEHPLGRRVVEAQRIHGLDALHRVAHQLHEASCKGIQVAINGLAESERTAR